MSADKPSAEIYELDDARARRQASDLPGDDYRDAGAHLCAVREAAGLSLEEAAAKTHIKVDQLRAIEEIDVNVLPARPYAIGFVKTYAEFLGLDSSEVVGRFKEDAGYSAPQQIEVEKFEAAEQAAEAQAGQLSLVAVIAVILFFLWCLWQVTVLDESSSGLAACSAS